MISLDSWAVIIVNLNLKDDTTECIKSLLKAGADLNNIIVVDNGSTDSSVEHFARYFGEGLEIIASRENKGYAHAINLGIEKGIERNATWFFLMNNDTIVDEQFFDELINAVQPETNLGLYGPLICYYTQPDRIWYLGDLLIPGTLITINPYRGKNVQEITRDTIEVDFVHGCGMLVRRDVIDCIGNFDDSSLIYGEEIDFIWRARLAGFKAVGVPRAKMWHKISAIMGKQRPTTRYLRLRNQIRFYRRYSKGFSYIVMFVFSTARSLLIGLRDLVQGNFDLLTPLARGWVDGWFPKK